MNEKRHAPQNGRMSSERPHDDGPSVSRKDYDDFEFIVRDAQDFAALQPEDQIQRMFAHQVLGKRQFMTRVARSSPGYKATAAVP